MMPTRANLSATRPRRRPARAAGFTLIEAALTTVIVGTGVLAIVAAQQAYHVKNDWAQRTGTAQMLANEIREMTLHLPVHDPASGSANLGPEANEPTVRDYDDLDDFGGPVDALNFSQGLTFSPPINALGDEVPGMDRWAQLVSVERVLLSNIDTTQGVSWLTADAATRVTVTVTYTEPGAQEPNPLTTLTWLVTD